MSKTTNNSYDLTNKRKNHFTFFCDFCEKCGDLSIYTLGLGFLHSYPTHILVGKDLPEKVAICWQVLCLAIGVIIGAAIGLAAIPFKLMLDLVVTCSDSYSDYSYNIKNALK